MLPICKTKEEIGETAGYLPLIGADAEKPGDAVSINMIHSPVGGLISISKGKTIDNK